MQVMMEDKVLEMVSKAQEFEQIKVHIDLEMNTNHFTNQLTTAKDLHETQIISATNK